MIYIKNGPPKCVKYMLNCSVIWNMAIFIYKFQN